MNIQSMKVVPYASVFQETFTDLIESQVAAAMFDFGTAYNVQSEGNQPRVL